MNHLGFKSRAEMNQHLRHSAARGLHPLQQALTYGSRWVQFHDISSRIVRFGYIYTRDQLELLMMERGFTAQQITDMMSGADQAQDEGIIYSRRCDKDHLIGQEVAAYKAHVWPVEDALYSEAHKVKWQIDLLSRAGKVSLQAAFLAHRDYVQGGKH